MLAAAGLLLVVVAASALFLWGGGKRASTTVQMAPVSTEAVQKGRLSAAVSQVGTLTYRARPDGSTYEAINQASGTLTALPQVGDEVGCGDVLYRVDDHPVLLLCGAVPTYRALHSGDAGADVGQLNRNLHELGYDAGAAISAGANTFSSRSEQALRTLQHNHGMSDTGQLALGDVVFLPDPLRIAKVIGELGGSAQRGAPVVYATSGTLEVQVSLEASQQGRVHVGDRAQITLPGNQSATGRVARLGRIAQLPGGQNGVGGQGGNPGDATFTAYIGLDRPEKASGFDAAPVQVDIITKGVENALSVPVTAIVGKSGGGFAVEVVGDGGRRELVAVRVGLFDTTAGRVQVEGGVHEGDRVVVPSS
jgi:multidrug efflux pump subunit AcrA (membrane-fusion protein)